MRRLLLCLALGCGLALVALPQEVNEKGREAAQHSPEESNTDPWLWWKWANFVILAGILGYIINKQAGPYFKTRTLEIQQGISDASTLKAEAEARAAQIEKRLAGIGVEIEKLRADAKAAIAAETKRMSEETARSVARQQQQAQQELELMSKSTRHELKAYSADLAVQLAEQRLRGSINPETETELVNSFLRDMGDGAQQRANA